jgi:hypothetical protein
MKPHYTFFFCGRGLPTGIPRLKAGLLPFDGNAAVADADRDAHLLLAW